jgi:DNA-binding GntR family transcriptional regulator
MPVSPRPAENVPPSEVGAGVEQVHARLRTLILRGDLEPGEQISQLQLAQELGVSRTPLREALRLLQREGLVEAEPNRSFFVAGFSIPDVEQLYAARIPIEALAIRLTVPKLTAENVAELEGLLAQMAHFAAASDFERWDVPHRAFHAGLVRAAGDRITALLSEMSDHSERYRRLATLSGAPQSYPDGARQHRAILEACKTGDADAAAAQLTDHLAYTVTRLIKLISPAHTPVTLDAAVRMARAPLRLAGRS